VTLALSTVVIRHRRTMAIVGAFYGAALIVLFIATALDVNALVLAAGGLASVVLGPWWWLLVASTLRTPPARAAGGSSTASGPC